MMSLLISTLFIAMFLRVDSPSIDFSTESKLSRVNSVDSFINSWDSFVGDSIILATTSALENITDKIASGEVVALKLKNPASVVADCVALKQVNFRSGDDSNCYGDNPINKSLNNFKDLAQDVLGVNLSYSIVDESIFVDDSYPFQLKVSLQINYTVIDPGFAYWTRYKTYSVLVPIVGLRDPLFIWDRIDNNYMKGVDQKRLIREQYLSATTMNKSEFKDFVLNNTYIANPGVTPSYLQRLSDLTNGTNSSSGIESVIWPAQINTSTFVNSFFNTSFTDFQVFQAYEYNCDWNSDVEGLLGINVSVRKGIPVGIRFTPDRFYWFGLNATGEKNITCS